MPEEPWMREPPPPPPEWPVPELDDVTKAFPANALDWMPTMEAIPEEFKSGRNEWTLLANSWFASGLPDTVSFYPQKGVNAEAAYDALNATLRSYAPKHQHKIAAVAYMASCWFRKVTGWQQEDAPITSGRRSKETE